MSQKAISPDWNDWKRITHAERCEWYCKQTLARQEWFIKQVRIEHERLRTLCNADKARNDPDGTMSADECMKYFEKWHGDSGLSPWILYGLPSEDDERVLYGRAKGDPLPNVGSPDADGKMTHEERKKWEEDPWYRWKKGLSGDAVPTPKEMKVGLKKWEDFWIEWDGRRVAESPEERESKILEAIREAYKHPIPLPADHVRPHGARITPEQIAQVEKMHKQERQAYQEAKARDAHRRMEVPRQFGKEGGDLANLSGDAKILALAKREQIKGKGRNETAKIISQASGISVGVDAIRRKLTAWSQAGSLAPFAAKPGPKVKIRGKGV